VKARLDTRATDRPAASPSAAAQLRLDSGYIFVERVDETLDKVVARASEVAAPYPERDLWVANVP
jgi:hypothetical protein